MAYVKKLVMQGFKSFAKRTEIPFNKDINVIIGPNGSGKSLSYDAVVTLFNGEEVEIGKIVDDQIEKTKNIKKLDDGIYADGDGSIKIITLNKESMKVEKKEVSKFIRRSGEVLYKIRTRTGRELKATGCHPVMTFINGGVNSVLINELKEGSLIATPREIEIEGKKVDEEFARLIGYIIGDGYIARDRIEFVNADKEIINDFIYLTKDKLKLDIRIRQDKNVVRIYTRDKRFVKEIRDLFYKGYKETITSDIKKIPQEFMMADNLSVSNLLSGLYDTDGSVRKDLAIIEYCTKNFNLARQVQWLLLRFGIISKIKKRICNAVTKEKKVPGEYYYIYVYNRENFKKFLKNIPLRVKHKISNLKMHLEKNIVSNNNIDLLPCEINKYVRELTNLLGIRPKPLRKQYPAFMAYIENRCSPTREGIKNIIPLFENKLSILQEHFKALSLNQLNLVRFMDEMNLSSPQTSEQIGLCKVTIRNRWATQKFQARSENLQKFYNLLKRVYNERFERIIELICLLKNVTNSDIFWDQIVSIEKLDAPKYVYDLTIEKNHNFIANNIFVHNSNVADALCFVLGRLSIKSMRAAKSKNLIFMGSKYAKPSTEASVELIFDNSDRAFNMDSDEIILQRVIRKNGQGIYKINNETKTRGEIVELLAQVGIDAYGYNIILQGQIQSIVRVHPEERRKIIEEVAGISVYEVRKEKSLHELEKTEERLKEITTILREKSIYLKNLEQERAQAVRYKELEKTIRRAKATIISKRIEEKKKELAYLIKNFEEKEAQKAKIKKEGAEIQVSIDKSNEEIQRIHSHIQKVSGVEQEELHNNISDLKAEIEGLKVRKENYENRKKEVERRASEIEKSIPSLEKEIEELKEKSPIIAKKSDELNTKKQELALLEDERRRILGIKSELQTIRELLKDKEKQLERTKVNISSIMKELEERSTELLYSSEEICAHNLRMLNESIAKKKEHLSISQEELQAQNEMLIVAETEMKRANTDKQSVSNIDICPLCKSEISAEHKERVISESDNIINECLRKRESAKKEIEQLKRNKEEIEKEAFELEKKIHSHEKEIIIHRTLSEKREQLRKSMVIEKEMNGEINALDKKRSDFENKAESISLVEERYHEKLLEIEEISSRTKGDVDTALLYKNREIEKMKNIIKQNIEDLKGIEEQIEDISSSIEEKSDNLEKLEQKEEEMNDKFKKMFSERDRLQKQTQESYIKFTESENNARQIEEQINYMKVGKAKIDAEKESLEMDFTEYAGEELLQGSLNAIDERMQKAQENLIRIGNINLRALEVYEEIKKEYDIVQEKVNVLVKEKEEILKIVEEIDKKKKKTFMKTFNEINELFSRNFMGLSSKGQAYLEIENEEDIFSGGVNIVIKFAKGKYFDVTSLSGGEQTLVALSLLFAIQEYKPYHFYIFDEIDAALDKRNSERLAALLNKHMEKGQYIIVTHNDALITNAKSWFGVSIHEGVSKILSLKVDEPLSGNKE